VSSTYYIILRLYKGLKKKDAGMLSEGAFSFAL